MPSPVSGVEWCVIRYSGSVGEVLQAQAQQASVRRAGSQNPEQQAGHSSHHCQETATSEVNPDPPQQVGNLPVAGHDESVYRGGTNRLRHRR